MENYNLGVASLIGIGFISGIINTLAGAGSTISVSALMLTGIPAGIANGTVRIAIFLQNIVATSSYKQQKIFTWKEGLYFALPATLGAVIGALFAVNINDLIFERILGFVFLILFLSMVTKKKSWTETKTINKTLKDKIIDFIIFSIIGMYGGFIQLGVGFMLITGCVTRGGFNLVKANAIKLFIVLCYMLLSLFVFIYNDMIIWKIGLTLAIGNMLGAFIASRFIVNWGSNILRYIMICFLFILSIKFIGLFDLIYSYF